MSMYSVSGLIGNIWFKSEAEQEPDLPSPVYDAVARTCTAVKGKFDRSVPHLRDSASLAAISVISTTVGGISLLSPTAMTQPLVIVAALGVGVLSSVASFTSFINAIKA